MSTTIQISGSYSQKTEVLGKVLSHHTGTFDFSKSLGEASWSQSYGPAVINEIVKNAQVTVSVSAFGLTETLYKTGVAGHNSFKLELDSGNFVTGQVVVSLGT